MELSSVNILHVSALLLVLIGFVSLITGLIVLSKNALSKDIEEVTEEATNLAKKGLISDVGSSLQNASFLVKEMTDLIKTTRGIGLALVFIGIVLIAGSLAYLTTIM